jgi:hypothetical protein
MFTIKDLNLYFLSKLEAKDIIKLQLINKSFYNLCNDKNLWRNKILEVFPNRCITNLNNLNKEERETENEVKENQTSDPHATYLYISNPKHLYFLFCRKSKVISLTMEEIDTDSISYKSSFDTLTEKLEWERKFCQIINTGVEFLLRRNIDILRGDVIYLSRIPAYRNDGKALWDGQKAILLNYTADMYGSVSEEFSYPEFPLNHFHDSITHNKIIYLSIYTVAKIICQFHRDKQEISMILLDGKYRITPFLSRMKKCDLIRLYEYPYITNVREDDEGLIYEIL